MFLLELLLLTVRYYGSQKVAKNISNNNAITVKRNIKQIYRKVYFEKSIYLFISQENKVVQILVLEKIFSSDKTRVPTKIFVGDENLV